MSHDEHFDTATPRGLLRLLACSWPAWMLAPSIRRQAARDPLLEWDPQRRSYRRRDGEGGGKVPDGLPSGPASATGINANTSFPAGPPARETRACARARDQMR